jgi:hypothetical protein
MVHMGLEYFLLRASEAGNMGILRYIWKNHRPLGAYMEYSQGACGMKNFDEKGLMSHCMQKATEGGYLDILKFFDKKGGKIYVGCLDNILIRSTDAVVEFIIEKYNAENEFFIGNIVRRGNVKLVEMLLHKYPNIFMKEREYEDCFIADTALSGNLELVKFMVESGIKPNGELCIYYALISGNLKILDYLYTLGYTLYALEGLCLSKCVESNNLKALQWFHSKGANIWDTGFDWPSGLIIKKAACNGKKKFLKWFREILGGI